MESARYRIEVFHKYFDPRCEVVRRRLVGFGYDIRKVYLTDNYLINATIEEDHAREIASLLIQPVIQDYRINIPFIPPDFDFAVEVGFLPGVTDNVARTVRESIEDRFKIQLDMEKSVFSSTTYFFSGPRTMREAEEIGSELHNPLIQRVRVLSAEEYAHIGGMGLDIPVVHIAEPPDAEVVELSVPEEELLAIAREGIRDRSGCRRGPLALDMASMQAIREYFLEKEGRNPTDIEIESIAQTWSEHCKHTIFAASLDDDCVDGIFKSYIRAATEQVRRAKGEIDFCVSVFEDNAGGIAFDDNFIVADKVETHNSPSALDPFGGAITGIVGVNRDAIGFGLGAKPIANRYGFCFADPFDRRPLYRSKDPSSRMLSPRRILDGVVHGVNVGGNTSGIPTPQGFLFFDDRYKGKPLVFVGTVGIIPKIVNGRPSCKKQAMPGDLIVVAGGRVGRDGIHGATFSSEALSSGSPATAVQIGDPITQKKLSDAVVKEARDRGLYRSITDNGAGGLSCSVAEMARECGGFEVDLEQVPLKYPGLAPWQIWLSESQERMTLAVPEDRYQEFKNLMDRRGVETAVIGRFTDGCRGIVRYRGKVIFDLDMCFLHEGLPKKKLITSSKPKPIEPVLFERPPDLAPVFRDMTARLNTASFDFVSTQYDHEVQGNSVIKPLHGKGKINGPATVIRPLLDSWRGVVLSQALYPWYGEIDPYWMAACAVDTAIRNAVSVGGDPDRMALLDNFCWCDSYNPERLGQLKEAARACYDFAVAYGAPFISGKDSMFNDFRGFDEEMREVMISIPPTLLISSIGIVEDIRTCQTMDFKVAGDMLYIIGITRDEIGGSEYQAYLGETIQKKRCVGGTVPQVDAELFLKTYRAAARALRNGLASSCVSIERGGLGVALAKSAMAGLLGAEIDLHAVPSECERDDIILYSESQGRLLMSVDPSRASEFESLFSGLPYARIGMVMEDARVVIRGGTGSEIIDITLDAVYRAHKGVFKDF